MVIEYVVKGYDNRTFIDEDYIILLDVINQKQRRNKNKNQSWKRSTKIITTWTNQNPTNTYHIGKLLSSYSL